MNMEPIKAIIFDMDGTMVDNMAVHNRIWIEYLSEIGANPDPATFNDRTAGKTNPEIMRMYVDETFTDEQAIQVGMEKEVRYRKYFCDKVRPMPGLLDLLRAARSASLKLGIATSAPPQNVSFVLGSLGLLDFFDAVVNGEEIANGKPAPDIFLKAADRLNVSPQHCLVFEDARFGVEAARRAGMRAVMVTTGIEKALAQQVPGVWKAINDFTELSLDEIFGVNGNGK
jgi:beta-phosphoglucomutase family hydrolase